jgi:hydrogenase nickel incorporation protein HypA/HybF
MHELSLAQSILEIVQQAVPPERDARASTVRLRIGELAGVVEDSLTFCFDAITRGTRLEGSRLAIEHIPTQADCRTCGARGVIVPTEFRCPSCGGTEIVLVSGRELQVVEVELPEDEEDRSWA